jgi:hypothetical protein
MAKYRRSLPHLVNDLLIADEATMVFSQGVDLPKFVAFDLLKHEQGWRVLKQ